MSWWTNFILFIPGVAFAADPLLLSVSSGKAPLHVKVAGPAPLLERFKACAKSYGGPGFLLNWGDGSLPFVGCGKPIEHNFTVPGTYTVKGVLSHPGPTDASVTDWSGEVVVEVSQGKEAQAELRLLGSGMEPVIHFGTGLPPLRYFLATSRVAELRAELVNEKGGVLFSQAKAVSFSGEDELRWQQYGNGPKGDEYRDGRIRARILLTLTAEGKKLAEARSEPFEILAASDFRKFSWRAEKAPVHSIVASLSIFHPDCYSYWIDWGDGNEERSENFVPRRNCALHSEQKELRHTFAKAGSYTVRWYDNNLDPFQEARKAPGYMEQRVKVK